MARTLGIIGSGHIGGALARLAVDAGLQVVLSNSRGPESLAALVGELGGGARAASPAEAAQSGDLVIATIPLAAYGQLPAAALAGKTVIDTMNYYVERDGHIVELDEGKATSSELVQSHLAEASVVKAFNNIDFRRLSILARPAGAPDRSALPIAGDEAAAKEQVAQLLDEIGYDAVDFGDLAGSWRSEPGTPVYVQPYLPSRPEGLSQQEAQTWFYGNPGVTVPASRIRELIDEAGGER